MVLYIERLTPNFCSLPQYGQVGMRNHPCL
nr:MAG TPA: hypothetical protein [Herelleviridae sp.]